MANNRMFLIHRPTGIGVLLGKRMSRGWYFAPDSNRLNEFYEHLSSDLVEEKQDDFILAMEDCSDSGCFNDWRYTGEKSGGYFLFEITTRGGEKMKLNQIAKKMQDILDNCAHWKGCNDGSYGLALAHNGYYELYKELEKMGYRNENGEAVKK